MPKKSKASTEQKQRQKQSQNVRVVVNLPEKKPRKKRAKRAPRVIQGVDFKAFPPQIIYPQQPLTFYHAPQEQPSLAKSLSEPVRPPPSILEDIGQVGTEGAVEILQLPSRSETLQELESPVSIRTPRVPISLAELAMKSKIPKNIAEDVGFGISPEEVAPEPQVVSKKKRKTKGELRQQMEAEYQQLTGFPIKPIVSNKELKALIYAEKNRKRMSKTLGKIMGDQA